MTQEKQQWFICSTNNGYVYPIGDPYDNRFDAMKDVAKFNSDSRNGVFVVIRTDDGRLIEPLRDRVRDLRASAESQRQAARDLERKHGTGIRRGSVSADLALMNVAADSMDRQANEFEKMAERIKA